MSNVPNLRPVYAPVKPERDEAYLRWVRTLPCAVTGRPAECAHHLIGHGRQGSKVTDYFAFPLITELHDAQHRNGIHQVGVEKWEYSYGSQWKHVSNTLLEAIRQGILKR